MSRVDELRRYRPVDNARITGRDLQRTADEAYYSARCYSNESATSGGIYSSRYIRRYVTISRARSCPV